MAGQDYYQLLGVSKDADAAGLKKAYRKLAMKYHPDRNPDDAAAEAQFKKINEAYDVLKDDQKRAAYDRYGHDAFTQGGFNNAGGGAGGGFGGGAGGFDFSDIFDDIFGGGGGMGGGRARRGGPQRGADLRYNMEISLEEAFNGAKKEIKIPSTDACGSCNGSGAEKGTSPVTCSTCHGHGKVRSTQGIFTMERTCPRCHGKGEIIEKPCKACHGIGREQKNKTLNVSVPKGVEDGTRIRLAGEGEAGLKGGPSGDLYIFLSVKPHKIFQREGNHIYCRVPIPMAKAALGGDIEVPTIDGSRARVTIPEGTQTGRQFRLRGKGMSVMRSTARGDMYIHAQIETPVNLSKRQKELLKEFANEGSGKSGAKSDGKGKDDKSANRPADSNHPESEGFFSKVKDFFEDLST